MKRLLTSALSILVAVLFTVMLARSVAYAQEECPIAVIGTGGVSCDLTGEDSEYCYFSCDCGGLDGQTCCSRIADMGLECIGNAS